MLRSLIWCARGTMSLEKRQWYIYSDARSWEIKWAVFGAVILSILLLFVLAYVHARHRLAKGLEPLRYHAWLVQGRLQAIQRQDHAYGGGQMYREQYSVYPAYPMNTLNGNRADMAPPPPAYDPRYPAPPQYMPPTDTKAYDAASALSSPDAASTSTSPSEGQTENPYRSGFARQHPAGDMLVGGTAYRYDIDMNRRM
ncbi:hypothetical protein V1506DRAFT_531771 [Lipomyces tetrasporus]